MNKELESLKSIADKALNGVKMTDGMKAEIQNKVSAVSAEVQISSPKRKKWYWKGGLIAAACAAVVFVFTNMGGVGNIPVPGLHKEAPRSFSVEPERTGVSGVLADSGFLISAPANKKYTAETLKNMITLVPAGDFTLSERSNGTFFLKTARELSKDSVYRLNIADQSDEIPLSWAFQTEGTFSIKSALPANQSMDVPVNTGIEIGFSFLPNDIKNYFSIAPEVPGRFELHGKTAVFVPGDDLLLDTVYTVTIRAGLTAQNGLTLSDDFSFRFRTARYAAEDSPKDVYLHYTDRFTETYLSSDSVAVRFYCSPEFDDEKFNISVYRLSGYEQYLKIAGECADKTDPVIGSAGDYIFDTSGMTPQATFSESLARSGNGSSWNPSYFVLPENPGAGFYLFDLITPDGDAATSGKHIQKLVQVSDISLYLQSQDGETLVWLNDAETGGVLPDAEISIVGKKAPGVTAKTDQSGVARITIESARQPEDLSNGIPSQIIVKAPGGKIFADLINLSESGKTPLNRQYYTYVYTDREAYLPSDKVSFWGVVLPRVSGVSLPGRLTLDTGDGTLIDVDLSSDGTFSGEFTFERRLSNWYQMRFSVGGEFLCSKSYTVMEYTKPSYILSMETEKSFYRKGEQINVSCATSFFDGTPAAGLQVNIYTDSPTDVQLVTDAQGKASASFLPENRHKSWSPYGYGIYASLSGSENVYVSTYESPLFFPTDYMLTVKESETEDGTGLSIRANRIDYSSLSGSRFDFGEDYNNIRGEAAQLSGNIDLIRVSYLKHEEGEYYDFISKQKIKTYSYERVEENAASILFRTDSDGRYYSQALPLTFEAGVSYYANVNYVTPDGGSFTETVYFSGFSGSYPYYSNGYKQYNFSRLDNANYYMPHSTGDIIRLGLIDAFGSEISGGRIFHSVLQDKTLSDGVLEGTKVSVEFTENRLPNFCVLGAYFDGRHVYPVNAYWALFDAQDRSLNVGVTPDREVYKPGDTVRLDITVKDQSGAPVPANLVVSAADEAAFAVMDQYVDPEHELYTYIYSDRSIRFVSYIQHMIFNPGGAEGGGEGDSARVRENFVDTAAFIPVSADQNGKASVSFRLPDNLTSWRITAIAVSGDAYAGKSISSIPVSIPFFVNHILNEKYTEGDDVVLSSRAYGDAITAEDEVSYTVTVEGGGETIVKKSLSKAFVHSYMNFGKLPCGLYKATIEASCGDSRDAVGLSFEVVESLLEIPMISHFSLKDGVSINSLKYPVTLAFYHQGNKLYVEALSRMLSSFGARLDQKLANESAASKLRELSGGDRLLFGEKSPVSVQFTSVDGDYGVPLISYGPPDIELTAMLCATSPEKIDAAAAKSVFYQKLFDVNSSADEISCSYLGLAALGEPVLSDITLLIRDEAAFSLENRLNLALGLALLGDMDRARAWYDEKLSPFESEISGWKYLNVQPQGEDNYKLTSRAASLLYLIRHKNASALLSYVIHTESDEYLPLLDLMLYVGKAVVKASDSSSFSFFDGEKTVKTELTGRKITILRMNEKQFSEADFKEIKGSVGVTAFYVGTAEDAKPNAGEMIKLKKTASTSEKGEIRAGSLIRVELGISFEKEAPGGYYSLADAIPSGTRFISCEYSRDGTYWLSTQENHRLTFGISRSTSAYHKGNANAKELADSITIVYYVRAALPGEYVNESAVMQHAETGLLQISERGVLQIS